MAFITVYITHPSEAVAREISNYLIERRLVACTNIFPIESAYWWKESIENDSEWVSLVKSRKELFSEICYAVEKMHPYELPCIMMNEVKANASYEKWIVEQCKDPDVTL